MKSNWYDVKLNDFGKILVLCFHNHTIISDKMEPYFCRNLLLLDFLFELIWKDGHTTFYQIKCVHVPIYIICYCMLVRWTKYSLVMEQGRGSPEMHVPLRLLLPGYGGGNEYSDRRQLAVYNPPPPPPPPSQPAFSGSRFKLPEGWEVEEVPRADASRVDKVLFRFPY